MSQPTDPAQAREATAAEPYFRQHPRRWHAFQYVYPVISRRSKGLSIGINLNIDKVCNFDCVYCCVDRSAPPARRDVDLEQVRRELDDMIDCAQSGEIWKAPEFERVPASLRVIRDITFSGDGEPTSYPRFADACRLAVAARAAHGLRDARLVVHTDSSLLHREEVREGLRILDGGNGEVWAKLDAGTEPYYQLVNRTVVPFARILENILATGRERPLVIQSLFMDIDGAPVPDAEFAAYVERLAELRSGGCRIRWIQVYTVARATAVASVRALSRERLDRLVAELRARFPDIASEAYYGAG